ncbi:MAG TPA: Bax inhibitor-1/YccA family protein [Gemmatimonadales bacterium]|nr:Bax inhibitor-1/YccA family protein [Gemmatimonadales bacterium]
MTNPNYQQPASSLASGVAADERVTAFLSKVYSWMFLGLALTTVVAYVVAGSPALVQALLVNRWVFYGLMFAELGLVWWLSARVATLAAATAATGFAIYSALTGITLSVILLVYTQGSIFSAFLTAAAMFGSLAIFGTVTRRSLAGVGQFAFMGLIGLIVASVVGLFWQNDTLQFVISVVGVIVFTGLTAWDAQKLKAMALALPEGQAGSYAIVGALTLYLDFINLFLMLLRFMGNRRS